MTGTFATKDFNLTQVVLFGDSEMRFARPLSIYRLASHLRQHDVSCQPIWAWRSISSKDFYNICKKFINKDTLVVGISTTLLGTAEHKFFGIPDDEVLLRLKLIKFLAPQAKILVGGSQVVETPLTIVPHKELIDLFVSGQGENSLLAIVDAVKTNTRVKTVGIQPDITTQDVYPYNDFNLSQTQFVPGDYITPGESLGFEFARGCIFKCSFCAYELTGKTRGDYSKSYDLIREELIKNYNEHGTQYYTAVDDLLNDSEEKVNLILDVAESLPFNIYYSAFIRLDMLRRFPDMATKLKQSGLIGAFMGVETVNDASGRAVGKGLGLKRIDEAMGILQDRWKREVSVDVGLILGLPHDTPDTKYQLLDWLKTTPAQDVITDISIGPLAINNYRKISDIDKDPTQYGYTVDNNGWTNKHYNSNQALQDAREVRSLYYQDRKYNKLSSKNSRMNIWSMTYAMSISERPQDIMQIMLTDQSSTWRGHDDWSADMNRLYKNHRAQYLNLLLEKP